LVIVLVVVASWYPFSSTDSWAAIWSNVSFDLTLGLGNDTVMSFAQRLVLFFPFGLLLHRYLQRHDCGRPSLWAWGLVTALCLLIECLQPLVSVRHARLGDLLVASLVAGLGIVFSSWTRFGWRFAIALLLVSQAGVAVLLLVAHSGAGLADWDCTYPLLVGNENIGKRGWDGQISGVALYDRPLDRVAAAQLAETAMDEAGAVLRVHQGARLIYLSSSLSSDHTVLAPFNGSGPVLVGHDLARPLGRTDGLLKLDGQALLRSQSPPTGFCEDVKTSGSISIEAIVKSDDLTQDGPRRIVSNSLDTYLRNFTLGEASGRLVLRVRTPTLGLNGTEIPIETPPLNLDARPHHVLATFSGGVANIFVDGMAAQMPRYFQSIIPVRWQLWLRLDWLLMLCGLGLGALAWCALAPTRSRLRTTYMLSATVLPPVVFDLAVNQWHRHHPDPGVYIALTIGVVLGLAATWSLVGARRPRVADLIK